jgi:MinD superfamily P-loop ATPase
MTYMPEIDVTKCSGCGYCVLVCNMDGIIIENGVAVVVEGTDCDWCTYCEMVCPKGAIYCRFEIVVAKE